MMPFLESEDYWAFADIERAAGLGLVASALPN